MAYHSFMPPVDEHLPGEFCWLELATTDQNGARDFYENLFGWRVRDDEMGLGKAYGLFQLDGRDVAGGVRLRPDELSQGIPAHWKLYIAVDDTDAAAEKAAGLGGSVIKPAFDLPNVGRMAVIRDPTGAAFSIFQAKRHAGSGITREPGSMCRADLITRDRERATEFYSGLFGWHMSAAENDTSGYLQIKHGKKFLGGMPHPRHQGSNSPPHWLTYFQVADVDESAEKVRASGGRIWGPPMTVEGAGRMAIVADPQGAAFALIKES